LRKLATPETFLRFPIDRDLSERGGPTVNSVN
jgi:hypothetical protein